MYRNISKKIILVAMATMLLTHCNRSLHNSSSVVLGQSNNRHPKMDVLRDMIKHYFESPSNVNKQNNQWDVSVKSSRDKCSAGRLLLSVKNVKDPKQGADIFINFINDRQDFDIMVDWHEREPYLFYASADEAKMEENINRPEFLEAVRLIIMAANVTEHDGVALIAYHLMTWYPDEKQVTLFGQGLHKAVVSDNTVRETYEGKTKTGDSCEVSILRDSDDHIFSVEFNATGKIKHRFMWFNVIPGRQFTAGYECLPEKMFVNSNAVVDGKRKSQWTFGKSLGGIPSMIKTSFEGSANGDGTETLKIKRRRDSYGTTLIGGSTYGTSTIQANLCLEKGRVKQVSVQSKIIDFVNLSVIIPVPFLGISGATKFTGECEQLKLKLSTPLFQVAH